MGKGEEEWECIQEKGDAIVEEEISVCQLVRAMLGTNLRIHGTFFTLSHDTSLCRISPVWTPADRARIATRRPPPPPYPPMGEKISM